mmetsp:Transcript_12126/g.36292  ORF Transcript_12126/g.36292 Transcript_12126/m.36292 type:complete len:245 (-) Transcript_12126:501-1235(-)
MRWAISGVTGPRSMARAAADWAANAVGVGVSAPTSPAGVAPPNPTGVWAESPATGVSSHLERFVAGAAGWSGVASQRCFCCAWGTASRAGVASQRLAAATPRPGVASKRPGVASKRPGVASKRPGVAWKRPGVASKRPGVALKRPGVASKRPGVASNRPGVASNRPGVPSNFPSLAGLSPASSNRRFLPPLSSSFSAIFFNKSSRSRSTTLLPMASRNPRAGVASANGSWRSGLNSLVARPLAW